MTLHRNLSVLVQRDAEDTHIWIAHCLDCDIITQGDDPADALTSLPEAVLIAIGDALKAGQDPFEFKAPPEDFEIYRKVQQVGEPMTLPADPDSIRVIATQLQILIVERQREEPTAKPVPFGWADRESVAC